MDFKEILDWIMAIISINGLFIALGLPWATKNGRTLDLRKKVSIPLWLLGVAMLIIGGWYFINFYE
jgi:hypothetical protein